ncbi:sugar ABC transporter substrate-binding protein [Candidatus Dependentiae bacterium]|nr:sugar ABC transporter substrate-binding protein [Candidatus Dependentiae bacterium]
MIKKFFFITIFFVLFFLISCSGNKSSEKPIVIKFWINPWIITPPDHDTTKPVTNSDFPEWISKQFMLKYPEVKVEYVIVSNRELKQKISSAIAAGTPPDIFKYYDLKFVKAGIIEPIDDYINETDKNDFIKQSLEFGEYNGKHYLWPWHYGTNGMGASMLLYKERFVEAGIDIDKIIKNGWTMSEFLGILKKISEFSDKTDTVEKKYAIAFSAKDELNILAFIYNFGGRLFNDAEDKIILNSPETINALKFLKDLVVKYKVCVPGVEAMDFYDIVSLFHNHKTAICFGGPYEIGRIKRNFEEGKMKETFTPVIVPFPRVEGINPSAHTTTGGFIVFKQENKKKKKYVMELAKFITSQENIKYLETINYITSRKSVNRDLFNENPIVSQVQTYSGILENYGKSLTGSEKVRYSELKKYIITLFETVFHGKKSVEESLDEFDNNIKNINFSE